VTGLKFQKFTYPTCERLKLIYTVGYSSVPEDLKQAVLAQIYWSYENRGNEENSGVCKEAEELCKDHVRLIWS
jgi:hypothetical protein